LTQVFSAQVEPHAEIISIKPEVFHLKKPAASFKNTQVFSKISAKSRVIRWNVGKHRPNWPFSHN
jgi:hypothetical protein